MAAKVITGYKAYLDHLLLTNTANAIAIENTVDVKESTVLSDTAKTFLPSLKSANISASGFVDLSASDSTLISSLGLAGKVLQVFPNGLTENEVSWFGEFLNGKYDCQAAVGEIYQYSIQGVSNSPMVRGYLNVWEPALTTTGTGYGDAQQIGSTSSTQRLYAALNLSLNSGSSSIVFTIESDDNPEFSSPTTRITFATVTGTITSLQSVQIPAVDSYFRCKYVVTGAANWTFAMSIGIA